MDKPYRILVNYGAYEGWRFKETEYDTATAALVDAMKEPNAEFKIVKICIFNEVE